MKAHIRDYAGGKVAFIGIGGCSMSGLATLMKALGYTVKGSDRDASHKTDALEASGIPVKIGHEAENVHGVDFVVYTAAISPDNIERLEAERLGIPQIERAELIGQLMEGYGQAIGISGTHGKTTTTAMMSQVFVDCQTDPTVHIGGELDSLGGSTLLGKKDVIITEACEFAGSFLKFKPTIAVILNIDEDHLDYYKDIDDIERAFADFAAITPEQSGWCVGWGDDMRVRRVLENSNRHTRTYGLNPYNEIRAEDISYDELGKAHFRATLYGHQLCEVQLAVAGEHNLLDALAVIAVASICELPMSRVAESLERFTGAHRRFDLTSVTDAVRIYQDYGHNPTEIKNALKIAKLQPHGTLWAVWQPHTYSRTKKLFNQFLDTFHDADKLLITDICAAREADPGDISSKMLIAPLRERGCDAVLTPGFDDAEKYLRAHWKPGDLVITLGCGNIDLLNEQIALHGDSPDYRPV
ncbi:MAG: UDP-N-acetylmuramate--L-alanine ligase [Clostridia bacterium]|nr:UDP-N-acetylmuramate--L-alanine ligase [Clostridia bacterium]